MVGRTIGKYRIVEQIGRGGMGTVYKAIDETLDRTVAIKILNADLLDPDSVERFRREAVTLARLSHPRIGAIHELTRDGHDLLMVMEFISGETFEKLIERAAPLPIPHAVRLCSQVLEGLQYAHNAGVVHRDLKPANVIVTPTGDVKIMDFGIARVQGSEHLTSVGFMVGTPAYMSPEQVRGEEVDPRMDLYSIAVVLYRLLTHHLPYQGDTAIAMIHAQLSNPPTPARQFRADLPDWIVATLTRGLAKSAVDRFQTAIEFRIALENGLTGKIAIADILGAGQAETIKPTPTPPAMRVPQAMPSGIDKRPGADGREPRPSGIAATPLSPSAAMPMPLAGTSGSGAPSTALPQPPVTRRDTTVTLRAPHLATAGVLVAALIAGIGILAFVALRTPTRVVTVSNTGNTNGAVSTSSGPAPAAATAPTPHSSAPVASPAAATAPAATPPAVPSTAPAPATPPPIPTPAAKPVVDDTAVRSRMTAPSGTSTAAAPAARPAAPGANTPAEHFADIKVLSVDGSRTRELDALLSLEPGTLAVRGRSGGDPLRSLSYREITAGTYVRARRPRGQTLPDAVAVPENIGGAGLFGGSRHWLTLQTSDEFLVLRLEDRNVIRVIQSVEARTGIKIERMRD